MTARSGMAGIIARVREMCELGTVDYSVAGSTMWTDAQIQSVLDQKKTFRAGVLLTARPRPLLSDNEYLRYELELDEPVEGTASGTPYFGLSISTGAGLPFDGTPGWTFDEDDKAITFSQDTEGTAYYWTGYSFNINEAARAIWLRKAAHYATAINFAADGARFDRAALQAHCLAMAGTFAAERGITVSEFVRTDLQGGSNDGGFF